MAKILIIDDEESIRYTFETFLVREGHEVVTAWDFSSAAEVLKQHEPDVVFADILLGDGDGLDIVKLVREKELQCPVIMITGEPSVETAAQGVRYGAFDYTAKPVKKDQLLRLTRSALRHKALEDEKKNLEAEKERLRLNMEAVFRSIPDAIMTVDTDMRVLHANEAALEFFGFSSLASIKGEQLSESFSMRHASFFRVLAETIGARCPIRELRVECSRPGGRDQTVVLNCSPLQGDKDDFLGAVLVARDITQLAGMDKEFSRSKRGDRRMVGDSPKMREFFNRLDTLCKTDSTVLLTGSSGTGKELAAEALHHGGLREGKPLVKVNCSALSEHLLESELFGHVRGAFTGAIRDKEGRFSLAHTGTIFLDEIGDISPRIQLKLLRVLQEREFERVGDSATIKVDVRVVAATNRNLKEMVRQGAFREDLYYRLKVVELTLPDLRERKEDIPKLVRHFMDEFNAKLSKNIASISDEAMELLKTYPWPGNIRELKHALEHSFILCLGDRIDCANLPPEIRPSHHPPQVQIGKGMDPGDLKQALSRTDGNKAKAARLLGVSRQTIYRKLKEYGMA